MSSGLDLYLDFVINNCLFVSPLIIQLTGELKLRLFFYQRKESCFSFEAKTNIFLLLYDNGVGIQKLPSLNIGALQCLFTATLRGLLLKNTASIHHRALDG